MLVDEFYPSNAGSVTGPRVYFPNSRPDHASAFVQAGEHLVQMNFSEPQPKPARLYVWLSTAAGCESMITLGLLAGPPGFEPGTNR